MQPADIAAGLKRAVGFHQQGQLDLAEPLYREVLARAPAHFDALHLLGVLQYQKGRYEAAVELIGNALKLSSSQPAAHSNLGLALQKLGRPQEALASFDRALALRPDYAEALNNRGHALRKLGRPQEALAGFERALSLKPGYVEALGNRASVLQALGRPEEALASCDRALALKPGDADAHGNRGSILQVLERPAEALASYDRALALNPDDARAHCNRGVTLQALKRTQEALASYDRALGLDPDYVEALSNRSDALRELGRPAEALASCDRALALEPGCTAALCNRSAALQQLGCPAEALASCDRALELEPDYAEALYNRGTTLQMLNRPEEALASYGRALALEPGHAAAHWNESLCRLLTGDFERGWREYEWRGRNDRLNPWKRDFSQPPWLGGQPIAGRTILLHAEQGLGDTIQFCRYARLVAERGATVLLEVQPPLRPLLEGLRGVSRLLTQGEALPAFDCHTPLLSLPLAFDTRLDSIPADVPYLGSDPERVDEWRARLGPRLLPRVGLTWSGTLGHKNDHNRSIPLAQCAGLLPGGVQAVSLQKDLRASDAATLEARGDILHFGDALMDFADTAALVELMDVVVTVDTSVAHLAGAMGKPVWILLPFAPDWRWLLEREDSPWYPTARLFRQPAIGDWASVIDRAWSELRRLASGP